MYRLGPTFVLSLTLLLALAICAPAAVAAVSPTEVTSGAQATGFDWSLMLSLSFGVVGLIWIRRRISQL